VGKKITGAGGEGQENTEKWPGKNPPFRYLNLPVFPLKVYDNHHKNILKNLWALGYCSVHA